MFERGLCGTCRYLIVHSELNSKVTHNRFEILSISMKSIASLSFVTYDLQNSVIQ